MSLNTAGNNDKPMTPLEQAHWGCQHRKTNVDARFEHIDFFRVMDIRNNVEICPAKEIQKPKACKSSKQF